MSVINGRMPINSPIRELQEQDAVKYFKDYIDFCEKDGMGIPSREPYDMAIAALEEIQQYRAFGTVRQVGDFIADWRKYREIGNLEQLREAMEKQRWIPCSERLPEEHDSIFAKFKGTDKWRDAMFEKTSNDVNVTVEFEDGKRATKTLHTIDGRWNEGNRGIKFKVVAWQPLPEPYIASDRQQS